MPELPNTTGDVTDEDCQWALDALMVSLTGSLEEMEVALDYLAAHWQGLAEGKHQRNRVNDMVICGPPATGKDLFADILTRSFPCVYGSMTDADLDQDCKGNDVVFGSSVLIMNEAEGSKRKIDNATFKKFCDSPGHRYRAMKKAAVERPRVGLCIRLCNKLGMEVDASTARKIAFFQCGPSAVDPITQKPKDPEKSKRLERILQTSDFILWFRKLLAERVVDVQKCLYGHGCEKFRQSDASFLYGELQAIENGETGLCIKRNGCIKIQVLSAYLKGSTAKHEVGSRPPLKISAMIESGQIQWKERRNNKGRLTDYYIPAMDNQPEKPVVDYSEVQIPF